MHLILHEFTNYFRKKIFFLGEAQKAIEN